MINKEQSLAIKTERLFTLEETAKQLGVKTRTMYDYMRDKKIRGVKIGKFWKIKESEIAYIKENGLRN